MRKRECIYITKHRRWEVTTFTINNSITCCGLHTGFHTYCLASRSKTSLLIGERYSKCIVPNSRVIQWLPLQECRHIFLDNMTQQSRRQIFPHCWGKVSQGLSVQDHQHHQQLCSFYIINKNPNPWCAYIIYIKANSMIFSSFRLINYIGERQLLFTLLETKK